MADVKTTGYPQAQAPPPYNAPPAQAPPPAGYPPPMQPTHQTVVVTTVSSPIMYKETPVMIQCPNCQNQVTSTCIYENGLLVWIIVLVLLFVFQLWLGCCLIPLCINAVKDVRHMCPVCKYNLGYYKRI
ncbi:LITAF domain-containing protein-like [Apostichopus japonicus]|uniref:LITAF domain-containing protein-like n=1 Tax=Stichopus japonicus TaxID=307972 RepID=UPI003AB8EDDC